VKAEIAAVLRPNDDYLAADVNTLGAIVPAV
jgi:hypothetical protein